MRKTEYRSKPRWRLWLLILAGLLVLACDVSDCWRTGGRDGSTQPAKPPCSLVEHFDYPTGSFPSGWQQFGSANVNPRIEEVEGNKVLRCSQFEQGQEKFLIYGGLDCQAKQLTVKVKPLSDHDYVGPGIIVGEGDDIRVALNPFHDHLLIEEHRGGKLVFSSKTPYKVEVGTSYWVRIVFNYPNKTIQVQISTDGSSFNPVASATVQKLIGKFGLVLFGPHPPEVLIDDFIVESQDQPVQPPKSLKVPPKIVLTSGIWVDEEDIWLNIETVTAKFTIRNEGEEEVTFAKLLATGRGVDQDLGYRDFTARPNVTLKPHQEYAYEGTLAFPLTGKYRIFAAYLLPDTYQLNPANNSAWWTDVPPAPNSGAVQEVRVRVREQTEMERVGTNLFLDRYGYKFKERDNRWTKQELDWLQTLLRDLPDTYHHMKSLRGFEKVIATRGKGGAEYLPDRRVVQVTDEPASDNLATEFFKFCWPYDNAEQKFRGYLVHELTHALQFCEEGTKNYIEYSNNPLVKDYAVVAKWKTGDVYEGYVDCLPGFHPDKLRFEQVKRGVCLLSAGNVLEDMAEAARYYVVRPKELRFPTCKDGSRKSFLKERVFKGKDYGD